MRRIMVAAPKSGSGKTTITCVLLQSLKNNGMQVVSYKCGPDYIDPMFHERVLGIPAKNLDTFFTGEEQTRELFLKNRTDEEFVVLEGVMGLFDGLGGTREEGSSYHLAKVTKTPIMLVVDAKGMGRSVIPMIAGFLAYDTEQLIRGVLLNRMSGAYYDRIRPLIEEELQIKVFGYFPERKDMVLESRHLGLVLPNERKDIQKKLQNAAQEFVKTVSLEKICQTAEQAEALAGGSDRKAGISSGTAYDTETTQGWKTCCMEMDRAGKKDAPVIAVARDEAFCFYYEDNLRLLQEYGARLDFFSPLHDQALPERCHALLLGGGYPELYAEELSRNLQMRKAIKQAVSQGMPVVAECGGFMYLHSAIRDREGTEHPMAGVLTGVCADTGKLVRFGYMELEEKQSFFLPRGEHIRGHEFHYFDSTDNGEDCLARKPVTERSYSCMIEGENYCLGFPHLYYPSNPSFAKAFVEKAAKYQKGTE